MAAHACATLRPPVAPLVALVGIAGLGYLGLVLLTWQALRAQPLIAPPAPRASTRLALLTAASGAALVVLRQARSATLGDSSDEATEHHEASR